MSRFQKRVVFSIPTAPTIYLSDSGIFNKNTRGQKGADKANDAVLLFFGGTGDGRI